ncbi:hypothetical protein PIB30_087424, partial [Stylosanthes scabra]|nr:hypothetical protein [Stylosanthes scabra]
DIILKTMLTRIGGSRIPWVTRSSSLTDSTVSSATSRPKRHCDLPHEDDHSDGPPPRSRYVSTDPYLIRLGVSFPLRKDQQRREATILDKTNEIISEPECQFRGCQDEPGLRA